MKEGFSKTRIRMKDGESMWVDTSDIEEMVGAGMIYEQKIDGGSVYYEA